MSVTFSATDTLHPERKLAQTEAACGIPGDTEEAVPLNVANANACVLLALLGFDTDDLYGEVSLPEMRRALMRARARLERDPSRYTRPPEEFLGAPRVHPDGTIEVHPVRAYVAGLPAERLEYYLERLWQLVLHSADAGATIVRWG